MATREQLKDEFRNGNLATGERFAELIDSMKAVQEPVADPQALGTSLSFIDSISQDADGKITATKKTLDLANAHELNPFKGWYNTGDTLPTDGFDGAYLYFKDTSELTGLTTIYRWNGTTYADTGTVVDTSNVQTFASGQQVNSVKIKNENGAEDAGAEDVLSAEAGAVLKGLIDLIDKSKGDIKIDSEFTFVDGYFRNIKTRTVGASANWRYVRKELNKGDIFIAYNLNLGTANTCLACLVDSSGNFVEEVTYQNHWTYYVAEENCIIEWNQRNNETLVPIVYRDSSTDAVTYDTLTIKDNKGWIDNRRLKSGTIDPQSLKWVRFAAYNSQSDNYINGSGGNCACVTEIPMDGIHGLKFRRTSSNIGSITIKQYDANGNGVWYDVLSDWTNDEVSIRLRFGKFFRFCVNPVSANPIIDARTLVDALVIETETDEMAPVVYYGEPILPKLRWKHIGQTYPQTSRVQGGDAYNGILFQFLGQDRVDYFCGVYVIDLATGRKLQEIELGYEEGTHNNTVCFGTQKYDENDDFPLLYASRFFSNPLQVYVYRVTVSNGVYSLTKVQTINLTVNGNRWASFVVDKESGYAYVQSLEGGEGAREQVYYKFAVPDVSVVSPTLNYADAVDTFRVSRQPLYDENVQEGEQDCIIHDSKLYMSSGFSTGAFVNVIDLQRKAIVTSINLTLMIPREVESVFFYGEKLGAGFNSSGEIIGIDFV